MDPTLLDSDVNRNSRPGTLLLDPVIRDRVLGALHEMGVNVLRGYAVDDVLTSVVNGSLVGVRLKQVERTGIAETRLPIHALGQAGSRPKPSALGTSSEGQGSATMLRAPSAPGRNVVASSVRVLAAEPVVPPNMLDLYCNVMLLSDTSMMPVNLASALIDAHIVSDGRVLVNKFGQSSEPSIFACGIGAALSVSAKLAMLEDLVAAASNKEGYGWGILPASSVHTDHTIPTPLPWYQSPLNSAKHVAMAVCRVLQ
ncbi:hypothetical protein KIPB_009986, partial [Kipferlia bialata]|eukprot:g9986.t1